MGAGRLINCQNDLDGMPCTIALKERGAILTDCPDHIFDLQGMASDGKRGRILSCRRTRCRGSLGTFLGRNAIGANLLAIIPGQMKIAEVIVLDHR